MPNVIVTFALYGFSKLSHVRHLTIRGDSIMEIDYEAVGRKFLYGVIGVCMVLGLIVIGDFVMNLVFS